MPVRAPFVICANLGLDHADLVLIHRPPADAAGYGKPSAQILLRWFMSAAKPRAAPR